MSELARPNFIERDPAIVEGEVLAAYETALGKPLFPGQLERLLVNLAAYRESLVRAGIQYAAEQNLVNYATGLNLDQLGVLLATPRIPESEATVEITFTRSTTTGDLTLPVGTSARQTGSSVVFAMTTEGVIPNGSNSRTFTCTASVAGTVGNGFGVGTITQVVNAPAAITSCTNTTVSSGGNNTETDTAYRARIKLAPNRFSVAGSKGAYKFYALSADSSIIDVAVIGPEDRGGADPVTVQVYPLTATGLPSSGVLTAVETALNLDTVRPLTDIVEVDAPTQVNYNISASITRYADADLAEVIAALAAAAQAYTAEQSAGLGRNIVRSQIIAALSVPGVYSVTLTTPSADIVVAANQWAKVGTINTPVTGSNGG